MQMQLQRLSSSLELGDVSTKPCQGRNMMESTDSFRVSVSRYLWRQSVRTRKG